MNKPQEPNMNMEIGIVKLKEHTPLRTKRQLECFFIEEGLFLGWTEAEDGIIVSDLERAKEIIRSKRSI